MNCFRRVMLLVLAMVLLLAEPAAAALPGPNASISADNMLKLTKKYDKSAYSLLKAYKNQGRSLMDWTGGRSRLTEVIDVTTHETCHSYMHGTTIGTRYYIGNGKTIQVKHSKVFRSKKMAGSIPKSLRTFRYNTYVGKPVPNLGSDVAGIYGLMNEFTAYYWGMHVTNSMIPYYEKYCTNFNMLHDYLNGCENNKMAYSEFRYYMLHYMYYAKKHHPDVYRGILRNAKFLKIYKLIEAKFRAQIKKYEKELDRLKTLLKRKGYTLIYTQDSIFIYYGDAWGYEFALGRFTDDYNKLINVCKKSKYASIEKKLKR